MTPAGSRSLDERDAHGPMAVLAVILAMALVPVGVAQTSPEEGFEYRLELTCPGEGTRCPVRAVDGQDAMGDPALAVDPFRPTNLIIASLHGGANNDNAPSVKSRSGLAFTTFTSTNGGVSWWDNPYSPPDRVFSMGAQAWGETPALTLAPFGQAFVGSLYSVSREQGGDAYDYVLAAQKFRSLQSINEDQDGQHNSQFLVTVHPGNAIRQMWYEYNPHTDNMTVVWPEQTTPHSRAAPPGMQRSADTPEEAARILREAGERSSTASQQAGALPSSFEPAGRSARQADSHGEPMSVIGISWTGLSPQAEYHFPERDDLIGPCETSTNPVVKEGLLYIGCKVAEGEGPLRWNPAAQPGDIEMFRVDPQGVPEYLGPAPVSGGEPKIGVRSDGRVAIMTVGMAQGDLVLDAAYGALDTDTGRIDWGEVHDYSENVPGIPDFEVVDANIQDMLYREYSGVIHLILKRNVEREERSDNPPQPFDPTIRKSILAIDEEHGFLAHRDLDVGNIFNRTDGTLLALPDEAFDDVTDDFLELPPMPYFYNGRNLGDLYQRQFFAVGDYGQVIFAEVVEITDLRGPAVAAPALPPPAAPAPAPAAVSTTAVAGALSASGVTAFAAAKMRRKVAAGAKKKR